jgi:hypothetical protein
MRMSVIEWRLDSGRSIRAQVMRGVVAESDATMARERSRVAEEGRGARLLDPQEEESPGSSARLARK